MGESENSGAAWREARVSRLTAAARPSTLFDTCSSPIVVHPPTIEDERGRPGEERSFFTPTFR